MIEGQFYHVYNRGNNKEDIFFEEKNYVYFLKQLIKYTGFTTDLYCYCLMPNHFHLLIKIRERCGTSTAETDGANESHLSPANKSFKDFFISYAKSINKSYSRSGSLFQAKYKKKLIDKTDYLLRIIPYIHNNPVRAGLAADQSEWKYSSYNEILAGLTLLSSSVLALYNTKDEFIEFHKDYYEYQKLKDYIYGFELKK